MYKTLFKTEDELKDFVDIDSLNIRKINNDLHFVERKWLVELIGSEQYTELLDAYHDEGNPIANNEPLNDLLTECRGVVANLAVWQYADKAHSKGNTGIKNINKSNEKQLWEWQLVRMKDSYRDRGFNMMDLLLAFLEEKKDNYAAWTGSDVYTLYKSSFVPTVGVFDSIIAINSSRRLYLKVKPIMNDIQESRFYQFLGEEYYTELKTGLKEGNLNDKNKAVLRLIQKSLVFLTMSESVNNRTVYEAADGIFQVSFENTKTLKSDQPAELAVRSKLIEDYRGYGEYWFNEMVKLLYTNTQVDYPTFFNSDAYTAPVEESVSEDDLDRKIFRAF